MKILLLYTTHEGQTKKIMQHIQQSFSADLTCEMVELTKRSNIDLSAYEAVIIASSIRYGYYSKIMKNFTQKYAAELNQKFTSFVGVNLVARKPHRNTPETNTYTQKFLAESEWKPSFVGVFAGAIYYPRYNLFARYIVRFIMWMGKGETDTRIEKVEYTNWDSVTTFAHAFEAKLAQSHSEKSQVSENSHEVEGINV